MRSVFLAVLPMSVTASWVIAAILIIRLLLKKAPRKYAYTLWAASGFRLCCPFSFESALSLFNLRSFTAKITRTTVEETVVHQIPAVIPGNTPAVQPPADISHIPQISPPTASADIGTVAAVIWCIGMAVLLGYAVFSCIRLKRTVRTAIRLEGNVLQADGIRSPFILGLIRPKIYIPFGLSDERLAYVLAHERCHLKRLDHIVKPAAFLLLTVHWFNPLVWLSFILMSRDMEMSCDEKVLLEHENIRKSYSITLLSFAAGKSFPLPTPLAFGESSVKSRIKNILNWKKPTVWMTLAAAVISVTAILCCVADPQSGISEAIEADYRGKTVSDEARDELVAMINSSAKRIHAKNYARSADDDNSVFITCKDGSFYELHYWYNSGFSFDPRHSGEDSYCSILTRYDADGKAERAWKMAYDFDEHFERWMEFLPEQDTGAELRPAKTDHVPWQCLYMTPFSSYYPAGGDSGELYEISEHSFVIRHRQSGGEQVFDTDWNWQEFPYSDEEWAELQKPMGNISLAAYSDRQYLPLSSTYELFRMNGELWIAKYGSHPDGERYLWSIYSLVQDSVMGYAEWEYKPYYSSVYPAFPFAFDLEYDELEVFCSSGSLVDFDAKGNQAIGTLLTLPAGSRVYWSPSDPTKEILSVSGTELHFTGLKDGKNAFAGTLYISGQGDLYTAKLVGTGLTLQQSEKGGGTVSPAEAGSSSDRNFFSVTFDEKDRYSTGGDSVTYQNPGSGGDAFSSNTAIRHQTEPIDPFRVDFELPGGWTVRQPEEGEATYASMTFQPMNIYDETGSFVGTLGFNVFTAEQAEIHSGEEPDGKWGPENYRGIYWRTMTGHINWNNDFTFVGDPNDGVAVCRIKYDEASPLVDQTAYNHGVLAYDKELMCWTAFEIIDGAVSEQEMLRLAESIRFAPAELRQEALPTPNEKIPSGYQQAIMGFDYDQQPGSGKIFNVELSLPEGWGLSTPGDAVYGSPINPVFSVHDSEGDYIATVHRGSYTPVPEAAGQWNEFRAVYSDIMLGSGYSWGTAYTPVTRTETGETATDEIYYADWFIGKDEPMTNQGILSYDSRYEAYIAIEFVGDTDSEVIRTVAESIRFPEK